ncbi:RNA polymerase subunit sigma [Sphingopyxis sp. H050]|jgi:RNA polymerase sigma factor (sigma-70 family)|uniref:sigma-70 family RNA polymerase sigma factor n=1 Tax=Sphingopyxis sp. H050 TaxID=1759072 RepID=UPI00073630B8|nr:sigma-70 family RNA polymerase sigma factor [Sphingopyxis sp. H050]KTE19771.1 RNA polymerase subunit sigma [Sphingopyxis sp. H050]
MSSEPSQAVAAADDRNRARNRLADAIEAAARRDRKAFRDVYRLTAAKLFGVCLRICGDRARAEDILQSAYIKIWEKAGSFDRNRASPISWLTAIARNCAIDAHRSSDGRARLRLVPIDKMVLAAADNGPSPDDLLVVAEEDARLAACLAGLEPRSAAFIRAAYFEGLTYAELAAREALPLGTMKSIIRRALLRLRSCLGDA